MGDAVESGSFESILAMVASTQRPDDVAWIGFVVGWAGPMNWENGNVREDVPYTKFERWNPEANHEGAPDGTLLFWCHAAEPGERTSFAMEIHISGQRVTGELETGRVWLRNPASPPNVESMRSITLSSETVRESRQRLNRVPPMKRLQTWIERVLRIPPPGNPPPSRLG
jgi:hypothetical protein